MTQSPSTGWTETVPPGEAERFAAHGRRFVEMQRAKSARYGTGRALHRKQQLGLTAQLEIDGNLPEPARHGLFARPGVYEARVRLSNGGPERAPDRVPDIRGFAVAVQGVQGEGALGGPTTEQHFLLINHDRLPFRSVDEFVDIAMAGARGPAALVGLLIRQHGVFGGLREAGRLARIIGKPFSGFIGEPFNSVAPMACGPYLMRVRLAPAEPGASGGKQGWAGAMAARLRQGSLSYPLQLQFWTSERDTPLDDLTVAWPESVSPWVTVGRLVLAQQDVDSPAGQALQQQMEAARFDPWTALAEHRPVGEVMRARKVAYFESQKARGAA